MPSISRGPNCRASSLLLRRSAVTVFGIMSAPLLAALVLALVGVVPSFAGYNHVRVVGVHGDDVLHLRAHPHARARITARLAFNARRLVALDHRDGWVLVRHGAHRGWVNGRYVARDARKHDTFYGVVGLDRDEALILRAEPYRDARALAEVGYEADALLACGPCRRGWCPVRVEGIDGWLPRAYLEVHFDGHDRHGYDKRGYARAPYRKRTVASYRADRVIDDVYADVDDYDAPYDGDVAGYDAHPVPSEPIYEKRYVDRRNGFDRYRYHATERQIYDHAPSGYAPYK